MRYRLPLITYIHGPHGSGKTSLAHALEDMFRGNLDSVQRINAFAGVDDLPIEKWKCPDRVIVVSEVPPGKVLRKKCYEVIEVSDRRRPAWLRKRIAKRQAGQLRGNEADVSKYDMQRDPS